MNIVKSEPTPTYMKMIEMGLLIRETEQALLHLFSQGKLYGTVHTCIGQELTGVAVASALQKGDFIFSNHRGHGHYLSWTGDVEGLISEIMGRETGVCGGKGGSQHLCKDGFYSNGIQGGTVPVAAGMALAEKIKDTEAVGTVFIGDGTLGEGAVYETLNFASKHKLPLLIVIENNQYAQSTAQHETFAGSFEARAAAFDIRYSRTSTWQFDGLIDSIHRSVDRIRSGQGPEVCIIDTYRLMAHSKGDDERNPEEVEEYKKRDLLQQLLESGEAWIDEVKKRVQATVQEAINSAEASPFPTVLRKYINEHNEDQLKWKSWQDTSNNKRIAERMAATFKRVMAETPEVIHLGEDIRSPYGGAFKATKGLSDSFPDRVINMPISEQAITGIANGLAIRGLKPITEIMFGDFMTLTFDQLVNHAAKFPYMFNDKVTVPMVIRTPMGGKRGYGPTHSQSLEKHFLGIPDVEVLAVNHRSNIEGLYQEAANVKHPTIIFEYKLLYARKAPMPIKGFRIEETTDQFSTLKISPSDVQPDITIVCYGEMLEEAEQALEILFDEYEIVCEILCPTTLYPLAITPYVESVRVSQHLLVVEEGQIFAGFGSELVAQLHERLSGIAWNSSRVGPKESPIPASRPLEELALPGKTEIVEKALEVVKRARN